MPRVLEVADRFVLRTDGGARGNPGPAGAGFVLENPDGSVACRGGRFLGSATNNVAEYEALLWGLRTALGREARPLTVYADSELVVRQVNGLYKVKNAGLKPLHSDAVALIRRIGDVRVEHVRREQNAGADALANEAMDTRGTVGDAPDPADGAGQGSLFG
jgi:ribonuclease HI